MKKTLIIAGLASMLAMSMSLQASDYSGQGLTVAKAHQHTLACLNTSIEAPKLITAQSSGGGADPADTLFEGGVVVAACGSCDARVRPSDLSVDSSYNRTSQPIGDTGRVRYTMRIISEVGWRGTQII